MKLILRFSIVYLLTFAPNLFSQEYHPLLNHSSWIINDWVSCCRPPENRMVYEGTDEVIAGFTYTKFIDPFPQPDSNFNSINEVYLREDVAAKKVYKIVEGVDTLLYDFSLQTGDVISQYGNTFTATVDYIILNDGVSRKRITLDSAEQYCGSSLEQIWIEGVGSNKHPFYPEHNMYNVCSAGGGLTIFTRCSFQNGVHIYGDTECPALRQTMLGVTESNAIKSELTFAPNPFNTELTIQSNTAFTDVTILVYNFVGQLVLENKGQLGNKFVIKKENLKNGLYFIQLYEKGKQVSTAKVVVN